MASQSALRLSNAFQSAKKDFLDSLKDPSLFDSVSNITSIQDVYTFTTQLQKDQSNRQGLRNLRKIAPYLDRLKQYAGVVEVFVQVKPEIMALIWGPIKLLLQMSDNLTQSFDAIVEAMAVIGKNLPLFEAYAMLFEESDRVADVLVLFYKDILDFYQIALNFFAAKRWVFIFDSVWPRHKAKINVVVGSIERHCLLMTEEVNLEHITEAHRARIADMDRWKQNFEFQERQNFNSVEAYISPKLYDDELDRLQRTVCERTGRWLEKDKTLKEWFDSSNASTRVVWLQGIPGAGKSHISSTIVEKLRSQSQKTLFVFLSYKQVMGDDILDETLKQDLRDKLFHAFQSSQRNLKSNTRFAREILTDLLKCVGPAYITIDGLDEIPESGRMAEILDDLLDALTDCPETKLLISSRAQDEIAAALRKATPKLIRVDDKNSGCIQAYVSLTSEKWLLQSGFDQESCSEINSLLTSLSAKSKGMFLYARVVMDNIQMCHTFDSVQSELRVLPENLEEAYARVLQRLHVLQPSLRLMSQRALGWIGCSPVPLKIQELSFALSLDINRDEPPRCESLLNIVRLCGPIVEISDDYVDFVHFTVKEYLFEKQEDTFIRTLEANLEMVKTCLHYLSFNIFEVDLEPDVIKQNILSGSYRLHWFAVTQWLGLIQKSAKLLCSTSIPEDLSSVLHRFFYECENGNYDAIIGFDPEQNDDFQVFKATAPDIHRLLHKELQFQRMDIGDWKLEDGDDIEDSWTNLDPLFLSYTSLGLYQHFESLLCPGESHMANCHCPKLRKFYGKRLFRCKYAICQAQQIAFETRSNRDSHCKNHDRSNKCPQPSCDFSTLGFSSSSQLRKHMADCHPPITSKPVQNFKNPDKYGIVPLLSDMIAMGMADEVRALAPRFRDLNYDVRKKLVLEAAFSGPLQILRSLLDGWDHNGIFHPLGLLCATESIKAENVEVLRWLISKMASELKVDSRKLGWNYWKSMRETVEFMRLGASAESVEVFEAWKTYHGVCAGVRVPLITDAEVLQKVLLKVKDPVKHERLAVILRELASLGHLPANKSGGALRAVASTNCSVSIARALLDSGADVNCRSSQPTASESYKTPLMLAAAKRSKEGADMVKLLLLAGADPTAVFRHPEGSRRAKKITEPRNASMEPGAKEISKWLGLTWDELVEWAAEQRSQNLQGEIVPRLKP